MTGDPSWVRRRAWAAREAARSLVKQSYQLRDAADLARREAEATLHALRETIRQTEPPRWLISRGSYRWSFRSAIVCPMRQGRSGNSAADRTRLVAESTPMLAFNGWEILPRKRYEAGAPTNELP